MPSVSLPVVGLSVNHHQLKVEASLVRVERDALVFRDKVLRRQRQEDLYVFGANLVYIKSYTQAKAT